MKRNRVVFFLIALCVSGGSSAECKSLDEVQHLDLATAQRIALADNPNLAAAAERVEQARHRIEQVEALYWPSLDAGGSAMTIRMSRNDATILSAASEGRDVARSNEKYQVSLGASWLLFDGFSRKFSTLMAEYGHQESEQARRDGMRLLLQSVAESFYSAQLALYNRAIAEADLSFNAKQEAEAQIRLDAGAGSLSAVLNFQVHMNNASTDILLAERNFDIALSGLAVLMGRGSGQLAEGTTLSRMDMVEESAFFELSAKELLDTAMEYRPDLLRQELRLQRAESAIEANKADFYPRLSLNGAISGDRSGNTGFAADDFGSSLSLNLTYNLFRGGGDLASVAEAKAYRREIARTFDQQKNRIHGEVRQAITRLEQARAQLLLQRASVKLVEQSRDLVEEGYKAGQESLAHLNEVQRDLIRTQSRLALSLIGLYTNRQTLKTATGESLIPYLGGSGLESVAE